MTTPQYSKPVAFQGVMVSSTFSDLVEHREALIRAIKANRFFAVSMENDAAKPIDVLDSSLEMVRSAAAYVGVISWKYGNVPKDSNRNPGGLSLTELEFDEARLYGRPVLIFIMGADHPVKNADQETNSARRKKLAAFRKKAMEAGVCKIFNDLREFEVAAMQSVAELRWRLDGLTSQVREQANVAAAEDSNSIPKPPALYAEPPYVRSREFVGREPQFVTLNDWAAVADPHPLLLFEAIGGAGKSMLTWEWTTRYATAVREDWAGSFWYSFYEKGATMTDFARRAIAYMTGRRLEALLKKRTVELSELLLLQLRARPWLLVLDGLERLLVAYHRIDAAQVTDEEAGTTDLIARRDPFTAIRPEDDDLLRALAYAAPSKLLVTSRLIPRVLLNSSNQAIPGVLHQRLPGLRPADAEKLLRSCGVTGTSHKIQDYLQRHCDCHPLVTGVLAGLVNDYLPGRGNFDAWADDPAGGAALNLADLDLVQKRNHILRAALDALPKKGLQLLSTLALLSEAVDYETISALNPHLPPAPHEVETPADPETSIWWEDSSDDEKSEARNDYETAVKYRQQYEEAVAARARSSAFLTAPQELTKTVRDLERRGLLQYDWTARRYDLHPVVRGIAAGGLRLEDREHYGQPIVDYFSSRIHNPYEEAKTLDDVRDGLSVVGALIQMGRFQSAVNAYEGDLANALLFNLEAHTRILSLLRPFFTEGWATLGVQLDRASGSYLFNAAGCSLAEIGETTQSIRAFSAGIWVDLENSRWRELRTKIFNIRGSLDIQNRIAAVLRCGDLSLDLAASIGSAASLFLERLSRLYILLIIGRTSEAQSMWTLLDPMGREWPRTVYRPGHAELVYATLRFENHDLMEEHLVGAQELAEGGRNHSAIRAVIRLRGSWQLERGEWALASDALHEALRMAREVEQIDAVAEAQHALARFHLGRLSNPHHEAEQLSVGRNPSHVDLAALWLAIGDREQAKKHALAAYKFAWADGEPYVWRRGLNKARALLNQLGAEIPDLPRYNPEKDEKLPWEDAVAAAIGRLWAEKLNEANEATDE